MNIAVNRLGRRSLCHQALDSLPQQLKNQLSRADRDQLLFTLIQLEQQSRHLDYLPVFGYLSLRSDNYRELGKASQADVVAGRDFEEALLPAHGLDFILSTVYRGTPERPGVVAGLSTRVGVDTPGVLLKVPKTTACLSAILQREFFAESDLKDSDSTSNSMYRPFLKEVQLKSGERVKALIFLTNPNSVKALSQKRQITAELLAQLMTSWGGFRRKEGDDSIKGGSCLSYWVDSYIKPRSKTGQPIDPMVAKAVKIASLATAPLFETELNQDLVALQKPDSQQAIERVEVFDSSDMQVSRSA